MGTLNVSRRTFLSRAALSSLAGAALVPLAAGRVLAAPDEREGWLSGDMTTLEGILQLVDGQAASGYTLAARVRSLNQRVVKLESAYGLRTQGVTGKSDLASLFADIGFLSRRIRALIPEWRQKVQPATEGAVQGSFTAAPEDPNQPEPTAAKPWPRFLAFNATAKLVWEETGHRWQGPGYVGGWDPAILQEGARGTISFSLRARGLKKQVQKAVLRVVVRVGTPFAPSKGVILRVYDVTWDAERALSDNALKTWTDHEALTVHGPYRWVPKLEKGVRDLEIEAHVLSVTHERDGTITFAAPAFVKR